jgi:hypothetical protein
MTAKTPPVPPDNQPKSGPERARTDGRAEKDDTRAPAERNLKEQGRHGNIHQNTHHQGYQQDR